MDDIRNNPSLSPWLSDHERRLADDALVLAYAMACKFKSMWVEQMGQTDEYTMQMLPHAIKILTTSRAWPIGEEHGF